MFWGPDGEVLDMHQWAMMFEARSQSNGLLRRSSVPGGEVSTVWLGMDHAFGRSAEPLIWETMVFGTYEWDGWQIRLPGRDGAWVAHDAIVRDLWVLFAKRTSVAVCVLASVVALFTSIS